MPATTADPQLAFPRFFKIGRLCINSYKVCLCVGIYAGSLATAALADRAGLSPSQFGFAAMASALAGLFGARLYHLLVHAPAYLRLPSRRMLWDSRRGGWSVFGALLTFVPASIAAAALLQLPVTALWDYMGVGVLAGGFWIRLGCVFNGCCAGRETARPGGVWLHDSRGLWRRRIPVQFLEMAWWLLGLIGFLSLWPRPLPPGSYALGVLGWYGLGRFFLEPLRERPDTVFGRVRINQVVAGVLAIAAAGTLLIRLWRA